MSEYKALRRLRQQATEAVNPAEPVEIQDWRRAVENSLELAGAHAKRHSAEFAAIAWDGGLGMTVASAYETQVFADPVAYRADQISEGRSIIRAAIDAIETQARAAEHPAVDIIRDLIAHEVDVHDEDEWQRWRYEGRDALGALGKTASNHLADFEAVDWNPPAGEYVVFPPERQTARVDTGVEARRSAHAASKRILEAAVLNAELSDAARSQTPERDGYSGTARRTGDRIFIVYGHDHALRGEVERFVNKTTGTKPIVFDDEATVGSETVIEKLERLAPQACFAIVLMTADDTAVSADQETQRARQNVLIEAGYFMGLLGRRRVSVICERGVEMASDFAGILYTDSANWEIETAKKMRVADLNVSLDKLL